MNKVLLVEDTKALAENIADILALAGFKVKVADNGMVALEVVDEFNPNLIVTDLLMPEMDGLTLIKTIRAKSAIPIIILSAKCTVVDQEMGNSVGANGFLTKPCRVDHLLESINKLLSHER